MARVPAPSGGLAACDAPPCQVLLLASRQPDRVLEWVGALAVAMLLSTAVLCSANASARLLGDSVVSALEKLIGLVLTAIAVEMVLAGLKRSFMEAL